MLNRYNPFNSKQRRHFLATLIGSASMLTVSSAASAMIVPDAPPEDSSYRTATENERYDAYIFGDEIDLNCVEYYAGPSMSYMGATVLGQSFNGCQIAFYGREMLSLDYGVSPDPTLAGTHIHELTHAWQFQNNWRYTPQGHCNMGHGYDLSEGDRFRDFCSEKQASIIQDYFRRFLMEDSSHSSKWYYNKWGVDSFENDALLVEIVEARFPNAREMRLALGRELPMPDAQPEPDEPLRPNFIPPEWQHTNFPPVPPLPAEEEPEVEETDQEFIPVPRLKPEPPVIPEPEPEMDDQTQQIYEEIFNGGDSAGKPTFYCRALNESLTALSNFVREAENSSLNISAAIDENEPLCNVFNAGDKIFDLSREDFERSGLIQESSLDVLSQTIARSFNASQYEALQTFLQEHVQELTEGLAERSAEDPSLPDSERLFVFEKIRFANALSQSFRTSP